MTSRCISIKDNENIMSNATTYKYLGNQLDRNLNLDENFERAYRKTCSRLHLLAKLRCHLITLAAMKIFDMVIMPLLTYSSIINLKLPKTQSDKLLSLECRASRIIGKKENSIECIIKKRVLNMAYKVLMNNVCENFNDYFAINYYAKNTRNRNKLLKLPRVNLNLPIDRLSTWGLYYIMICPEIYVPVRMIQIVEIYLTITFFKLLNFSLCKYS